MGPHTNATQSFIRRYTSMTGNPYITSKSMTPLTNARDKKKKKKKRREREMFL